MKKDSGYIPLINNLNERCIFIWSVPANGHLNPTICFVNQLLTRLDEMNVKKIVFYSAKSYKDLILNIPNNIGKNIIEFRDYSLEKYAGSDNLLKLIMNFDTRPGTLFRVFQCYENSVKLGSKHLFKNLIQDIHNEKPALIIYDQALFFPKIALELYAKKYKCLKPLHCCYVTTFMCARGIYPYWTELEKMGLLGNNITMHKKIRNFIITIYDFFRYIIIYYKTLWWDLGFTFFDLLFKCEKPLSKYQLIDDKLNLVFVLPEVQPRLESFQFPNIKFIGPSVDENVRSNIMKEKIDMKKYLGIIEEFLEKNVIVDSKFTNNKHQTLLLRAESTGENFKNKFKPIIYVSMGTVFNNENSHLFEILVEGCKYFSKDYAIIISTGDEKTYQKYADNSFDNQSILFIPYTPQVEILKRAHLFITHAGMNSVSEAINYGVPIICIPLSGDQPFVAWRIADELGLGIRLQPDQNLSVEKVKSAITTIINNPSYRKKAQELSIISKNYYGHKTACDFIVDFLHVNE